MCMRFNWYIEFKPSIHSTLTFLYMILAVSFFLASIITYNVAFAAPTENPPKQPIIVGAGNVDNVAIDKTNVVFNIPYQTVNIEVTLNVTQQDICFLYASLPFTVSSVTPYAIYNYQQYPLSVYYPDHPTEMSEIGVFDSHLMNTPDGLAVLNASIQLTTPIYGSKQITIGASAKINGLMEAIDDPNGGRKTVIYTFFGGNTNWTEQMAAFRTPICQQCLWRPFRVQIGLPTSYYLSNSQPAPIEYYVNQDSRWAMFSIDFLNGEYGQTLVCNFENPTAESNRQFSIFLIGVFVTLSATFIFEALREAGSAGFKYVEDTDKSSGKFRTLKIKSRLKWWQRPRHTSNEYKKPNSYLIYFLIIFSFSLIIFAFTYWVASPSGLHLQIDTTNVAANNTKIIGELPSDYNTSLMVINGNIFMAKIPIQNVPTVINGITAATSIIVGLSGAAVGIIVRELFQTNKKASYFLMSILFYFLFVFAYQFVIYILLVSGVIDMALRWSICGLLLALMIFVISMLGPLLIIELEKEANWNPMDY
jgi:hypothetical protein